MKKITNMNEHELLDANNVMLRIQEMNCKLINVKSLS